jgi:hypothetical protein
LNTPPPSGSGVCYAVPAYFHPADNPAGWKALAALGPTLAFAIVNPNSGPADAPDPRYREPIKAVHAAGGRVIGYVDTAYGHRPAADVLSDIKAYHSWYGLRGAFLDQVSSHPDQLAHYRDVAGSARRAGLDYLVINPGVVPHPGYAEIADTVVTFEGPWTEYRGPEVADWMRLHPIQRFCHLVYGAPKGTLTDAVRDSTARHVGVLYTTELTGANPWSGLSTDLAQCAEPPISRP